MRIFSLVRRASRRAYRILRHPKQNIVDSIEKKLSEKFDAVRAGTLNSVSRDEWVAKTLAKVPAGSRLLDAGAGEQRYRKDCSHLKYVSQDHEAYDGEGDGRGGQMAWTYGKTDLVGDICAIPEPDESFDAILCTEVLEHVPDPVKAVTELNRLLKPEGILIITAPFCSLTHFSPYHFSTGLSRYWYEKHLDSMGYDNIELVPNGNYFEYIAQELMRLPWVCSKHVGKPLPLSARIASLVLARTMETFSSQDRSSSEYLCYGWHVVAKKSAEPD